MNNNEFNNNVYPSNQNISNGYTQQPTQNLNNESKNTNIKKVVLIIVSLLVVGILVFVGYKFLSKKKTANEDFDINATTSFFLQDNNSKYALFNADGKQLTEFIYTYVGEFVNGTTKVKVDDQEGVINENGKMIVPLGKYEYITQEGALYSATEKTDESYNYNKYLIDGSGEILYNLKDVDIDSFIGVDTFLVLDLKKENKYTVINYLGKELVTFPKVDDDEVEDPSVNEEGSIISIFYNNKNWIFNVNTGKQLASFDSDLHYCVNKVSDDQNIITLNSCVSWYEKQDNKYYKFIKDGKLYDKTNECDKVTLDSGNLLCTKDSIEYLLDSNLNASIKTYGKAYSNAKDSYVMESTEEDYAVEFYQNGKITRTVSCRDLEKTGYTKSDIYILSTHYNKACDTKSGTKEYYKANGEKLIEKSFSHAELFDSNDLAKVSEDNKNYYMIDKTGKQVGNTYSNISYWGGYYIITNNNLKGIMNKEGKEVIPTTYSRAEVSTSKEKTYAILKTKENKYIVYNLDKNKELLKSDSYPDINYGHYITITSNGKTQYYTFDGKLFYEK